MGLCQGCVASVTALGSSSILVIRLPTPTHRMSLNLFVVLKSFHLLVGIIPTSECWHEGNCSDFLSDFVFELLRCSHEVQLPLSFLCNWGGFELLNPPVSTSQSLGWQGKVTISG